MAIGSNGRSVDVVVITGASAGVGRATAIEFARRGAKVGLIARGKQGLDGACREVEAAGGAAFAYQADVSDPDAVESAAAAIEDAFGPIDIWINDAMVSVFSPVSEMQPEEYRRVTEVNYLGYVHGTLAALRRMRPRDHGTIVQVASALSYRGIPLQSAYCATKHAIQGFNDSLHAELLHEKSGVRLTSVDLPAVNTPQFEWSKSRMPRKAQPVPPIYQPEVAARAIYWAAHHDRRELNVGWPTLVTKLGNTIAPGLADRYLARSGYDAQMTDEPEQPDRPDNLWSPVGADFGKRGPFSQRARDRSKELWLTTHRRAIGLATLAAGFFSVAALVGTLGRARS